MFFSCSFHLFPRSCHYFIFRASAFNTSHPIFVCSTLPLAIEKEAAGDPEFKSRSGSSQLVCLLPVGILIVFSLFHYFVSLALKSPRRENSIGRLRFDDGKGNDNATNQLFDWLNEENFSCYTCGTLFGAMFWRSLSNDDLKFCYLRFWRRRELAAVNTLFFVFKWKTFVPSKRKCASPICTTCPAWNNRKTLNLTLSSILMWRFRCSCRRSFLNSLMKYRLRTLHIQSTKLWISNRLIAILFQAFSRWILCYLSHNTKPNKAFGNGEMTEDCGIHTLG